MAFTALYRDHGTVDATREDLGCAMAWARIHRARPRAALTCTECSHPVHPKTSRLGLRYFAHDPGAPTCSLAGESMEHHLLKLELATAIRAASHRADLEVRGPQGRWRADIMASTQDGGTRMAWEAQLSAITADEIAHRTTRYLDDDVTCCWVTTRRAHWLGRVPSVRAAAPADSAPGQGWQVTAGLARFSTSPCDDECGERTCEEPHGEWETAQALPLAQFLRWALTGRAVPVRFTSPQSLDRGGWWHYWSSGWTALSCITAEAEHRAALEAYEAEQEQQQQEERRRRELAGARARYTPPARPQRVTPTMQATTAWQQAAPQNPNPRLRDAQAALATLAGAPADRDRFLPEMTR